MSIRSEIKLHEALRHAHGLPHHVKAWLAQPANRLMTGHAQQGAGTQAAQQQQQQQSQAASAPSPDPR